MKTSKLTQMIKEAGWYIQRHGGNHDIYIHDELPGKIKMPRHPSKEVGKGLENKILKMAGLK